MTDTAGLIRTLEDSGLRRQAAHAIASALEEQRRRSSGGVPPWALILAAGLVAGAIGFLATITLEHRERLTRVEERLCGGSGRSKRGSKPLKRGSGRSCACCAGNSAPQAGLRRRACRLAESAPVCMIGPDVFRTPGARA